jgi:hypothetical protein
MITPSLRSPTWFLALGLALPALAFAQAPASTGTATPPPRPPPLIRFPAPSPLCTLKQTVGLTEVEVIYSRPSARGRVMLGGENPYGQVWRTGANSSTKISFSTDVKLNGADVPAGTYALFTIPGKDEWTVIISKNSKQFGAFSYDPKDDLVRFKATPEKVADHVETFTITLDGLTDESAVLNLSWEHTRVPIQINTGLVSATRARIEELDAAGKLAPMYLTGAASFYLAHGIDLAKALSWVDAAIAARPPSASVVLLKGRIQAKMGDKAGALASGKMAQELAAKASKTEAEEYGRLSREFVESLEK